MTDRQLHDRYAAGATDDSPVSDSLACAAFRQWREHLPWVLGSLLLLPALVALYAAALGR